MYHSQLGVFSKLPVELRLQIWELIFLEIHSTPNPRYPTKILSILCCSHLLYDEISDHLYHGISQSIHIRSSYDQNCYITIGMSIRKSRVQWSLRDKIAMAKHLSSFPFARTDPAQLHIHLFPTSRSDPARIICLWMKVNDLVETVQSLPYIPPVKVWLEGNWLSGSKARWTFRDSAIYRPDYDIAIIPFIRLSRCEYVLPENLSNLISEGRERSPHTMVQELEKHIKSLGGLHHGFTTKGEDLGIEDWLLATRIFLDNMLDNCGGNTGAPLRRDRFMNWFVDGDSWRSPYQEQFIQDLATDHKTVLGEDPGLSKAIARNSLLIQIYDDLSVRNEERKCRFPELESPGPHKTWSSEAWSLKYPRGILPLSWIHVRTRAGARAVNIAYRSAHPSLQRYVDDLNRWACETTEIGGETRQRCTHPSCYFCSSSVIYPKENGTTHNHALDKSEYEPTPSTPSDPRDKAAVPFFLLLTVGLILVTGHVARRGFS